MRFWSILSHSKCPSSVGGLPKCPPAEVIEYSGLRKLSSLEIAAGLKSNTRDTLSVSSSSLIVPVPNVSIRRLTGAATPIT